MKATDIIKDIMEKQEVKPSMLAERLGIKNNTLSERMTQKNISVLKLSEMLEAIGYKIFIVPKNSEVQEGEYELTVGEIKSDLSKPQPNEEPPKSSGHRIKMSKTLPVDLDKLLSDDEPPKTSGKRIKMTK